MQKQYVALDKLLKCGLSRPVDVLVGKQYCFHDTTRVSLTRDFYSKSLGEESSETVAEVWPGDNNVDIVDGMLMAHAFNHFEKVVALLQQLRDKGTTVALYRAVRSVLAWVERVPLPDGITEVTLNKARRKRK